MSNDGKEIDSFQKFRNPDSDNVLESHWETLREILRKFTAMWDGSLGKIGVTEHRIDLVPKTRPISQSSYKAGGKAWE